MEPREEFFHEPGVQDAWSESYYADFVDDDVQGYVRFGFYPNRSQVNLVVAFIEDGTLYSFRDEEIAPADVHGLTVDRPDLRFSMRPRSVGEAWVLEYEGPVTRNEGPEEMLEDGGETVDLSLEMTLEGKHDPFLDSEGEMDFPVPGDRYEQAVAVEGTATVDGRSYSFDGPGERDHSWGPRRWAAGLEWVWASGGFDDGSAFNFVWVWQDGTDVEVVNGFWFDGEEVSPLVDVDVVATPELGRETASEWRRGVAPDVVATLAWDGGESTVEFDPFETTPIEWTNRETELRGLLNRSPTAQSTAAATGSGFIENMTMFDLE